MQQQPVVDDAALVRQAQQGSRDAFVELVRRHQRAIRQWVSRQVRDEDAADDLAQEVFLAAFRGLRQYHSASEFRGWLFGIARHKVNSHYRAEATRRRRYGQTMDAALAESWLAREDDPWQTDDEQRLRQALRDCLQRLAPASRQMVDEYYFEDRSAAAIGQRSGHKAGAIRMALLRIRQTLARCVEQRIVELEKA